MRVRLGVKGMAVSKAALRREGYDIDRLSQFKRVCSFSHTFCGEFLYPEHNAATASGGEDRAGIDCAMQGAEGAHLSLPDARHLRAVLRRSSAGPRLRARDPPQAAQAGRRAGRLPRRLVYPTRTVKYYLLSGIQFANFLLSLFFSHMKSISFHILNAIILGKNHQDLFRHYFLCIKSC